MNFTRNDRENLWRRQVPNPAAPPVARWLLELFARYTEFYLKRHFSVVHLSGRPPSFPSTGPLVIYLNHASWWDPLLCLMAARRFTWTRVNYAPIDQKALQKFRFFRRLGFFPVEKGSREGVVEFLNVAESLLRNPQTVIWITPQGEFVDQRQRPIRFKRGLIHLARRVPNASFVPLAIDFSTGPERLPRVALRFGEITIPSSLEHLERALEQTMDELFAEMMNGEAVRCERWLNGQTGTGGVYGLWQRLRVA